MPDSVFVHFVHPLNGRLLDADGELYDSSIGNKPHVITFQALKDAVVYSNSIVHKMPMVGCVIVDLDGRTLDTIYDKEAIAKNVEAYNTRLKHHQYKDALLLLAICTIVDVVLSLLFVLVFDLAAVFVIPCIVAMSLAMGYAVVRM